MFWTGFFTGLFIGASVGLLAAALFFIFRQREIAHDRCAGQWAEENGAGPAVDADRRPESER
jgi:hypothetical protein